MAAKKRKKKHEKPRKKKPVIARKRQAKPKPKAKARKHLAKLSKKTRPRKATTRKPRKTTPRKVTSKRAVRKKRHKPKSVRITARERALRAELKKTKERLRVAEETYGFVPAHDIEFLHRDGTVAKNPSIHRHRFTQAEFKKLHKKIGKALGKNIRMLELSREYEIPIQELYTLFHSP